MSEQAYFPESLLSRMRWRRGFNGRLPGSGAAHSLSHSGEFEGHRPWQSGEDIQQLDLAVWRRLRQRWIREYRQEADDPLHVIFDGGPSFDHRPRQTALFHIRRLLRGIARNTRVPYREWIVDDLTCRPVTWDSQVPVTQRSTITEVLSYLPQSIAQGRAILISDRLSFDELESSPPTLPSRDFQWWSLWLKEETNPSWEGDLLLQDPQQKVWQGHFSKELLKNYRDLQNRQRLILQDWLRSRGGVHVAVPAVDSPTKIIESLTAGNGPLEVVSG